jgi:formylglycine-generating enzyme required for sulfatase activity
MTEKDAQVMWPEWKSLGWFKTGSKELAPHQVSVRTFLMSSTEVTREQYLSVMKANDHGARGNTLPADGMTRLDALFFCNSLSNREGLEPAYVFADKFKTYTCDFSASGYRLPTEAEWEYAARGGASQVVPYPGSTNVDEVAWHNGNARGATHPVAQKKPNGYGLYDMAGNLWEMVWDWYGSYPTANQTDPAGPSTGPGRVIRGGSWFTDATTARSAYRGFIDRDVGMSSVGFRVVLPQK